jgi:hypothetical protein
MSLNAWEQHALDAIKEGLAGSDAELTAMLSAFTRLASGEVMPDREVIPARSRRPLRLRARRHRSLRRVQSLGFQRAALLLLWLLTTAALIAVVVAISTGDHGTCNETGTIACAGPAPGHSPGSPSRNTTTNQLPQQRVDGIPQAGP